jgi:predicted tellurium resistance membrane protein TerC
MILGMDIKAIILILLNIVLIETLLAFPFAIITGVLLNKLQSANKRKHLWLVVLFSKLLVALLLVFAAWLIRTVLWKEVLIGCYLIYLAIEGLFLKKGSNVSVGKFYLIVMLFTILTILESIITEDIFSTVAFTNSIYLTIVGFLISMLSLYWLVRLFEKLAAQSNLIRLIGYIVLLAEGIRAIWLVIDYFYFKEPDYPAIIFGVYYSFLFLLLVLIVVVIDRFKTTKVS